MEPAYTEKAPSPPVKSSVATPVSTPPVERKYSVANMRAEGTLNAEVPEVDESAHSSDEAA